MYVSIAIAMSQGQQSAVKRPSKVEQEVSTRMVSGIRNGGNLVPKA